MDYNKKIFISNIITFIVLLISFSIIHMYLQELNFESQYRSFIKYKNQDLEYNINISNLTIINNSNETNMYQYPPTEFKVGYDLIIPVAVSLILILNTLYYIVQKTFKDYYKKKQIEYKNNQEL